MRQVLSLAALSLLMHSLLFGQGNSGSILGTITDSSGAVVAAAKVSITNIRTGVQVDGASDTSGNYLFNFLSPSTYRVETEVAGFKKFSREVNLETGRQLRVDVGLETGAVTEVVNVAATTPLLETETGALGGTIENRQVISLPTIGRNPQDFRLLVPGVVLNRDGNSITQRRSRSQRPLLHRRRALIQPRMVWQSCESEPRRDSGIPYRDELLLGRVRRDFRKRDAIDNQIRV
ncbi:MAG TPA: carboxypeptidase-like regulatory domain-containing protein [Bryobacteraceae bacterium]|nr:carboxypeptidase-like regulatory domain-containing protein [Bryobacteraceae bacterium]